MPEQTFPVKRIRCQGCERGIGTLLGEVDGIHHVHADRHTNAVTVGFDDLRVSADAIVARLADAGYPVIQESARPRSRRFWPSHRKGSCADR